VEVVRTAEDDETHVSIFRHGRVELGDRQIAASESFRDAAEKPRMMG
jgi:hypothetical protein